jgi:hypothetical protein
LPWRARGAPVAGTRYSRGGHEEQEKDWPVRLVV